MGSRVYLSLEDFCVHAVVGLEDLLCFLLRPEKINVQQCTVSSLCVSISYNKTIQMKLNINNFS